MNTNYAKFLAENKIVGELSDEYYITQLAKANQSSMLLTPTQKEILTILKEKRATIDDPELRLFSGGYSRVVKSFHSS